MLDVASAESNAEKEYIVFLPFGRLSGKLTTPLFFSP